MGKWRWEGVNREGKTMKGIDDVHDDKELKRILRARGIRPKKIRPPSILEFDFGVWAVEKGFASAFGTKELINFTKQLGIMLGAGVPLLQTLEILYRQEKNVSLKNSIRKISQSVGGGKTLAESMAEQRGFDRLYCNLVKAGEKGGVLDEILYKLIEHMEKSEKTKKQIKSAMTYPAVIITVSVGVITFMLTFVVPQFQGMLEGSGKKLPEITQFVVDVSEFMQAWIFHMMSAGFIGFMIFSAIIKTPKGKKSWHGFLIRMPIFGVIVVKGNLSGFTRTLSTMITSGVSLIDSLQICIDTMENVVIADDLEKVKKAISEGKTLADPLKKLNYFPDMVGQMIKIGEQSGKIDSMLLKVADVFEEEVDEAISGATQLIEPFILVVLGGIVSVILIAMYMPIFKSAESMM